MLTGPIYWGLVRRIFHRRNKRAISYQQKERERMQLLTAAARPRNLELSIQNAIQQALAQLDPFPVWLEKDYSNLCWDEEGFDPQSEEIANEGKWLFDVWVRFEWIQNQITRNGRNILRIRCEGRMDTKPPDPRGHGVALVRDDMISVMTALSWSAQKIYDYGTELEPIGDDETQDTGRECTIMAVMASRTRDEAIKKERNLYGIISHELMYEIPSDAKTEFKY